MSLPAPLLAAVEAHPCFTGCYRHESPSWICVDATQPPASTLIASCQDCLSFRPGALASVLPKGMTEYKLSDDLTAHMRAHRGYRWAVSGYHASGPGFWLSAAYYGEGLFLVDGGRNGGSSNDVDVLIQSFKLAVTTPDHGQMTDSGLYATETVYLRVAQPIPAVRVKQDILSAPQCSKTPKHGYRRVSIVEFLPLVNAASQAGGPATACAPARSSAPPRTLSVGDVCPKCGAVVRERPLFSGSFVGCLC